MTETISTAGLVQSGSLCPQLVTLALGQIVQLTLRFRGRRSLGRSDKCMLFGAPTMAGGYVQAIPLEAQGAPGLLRSHAAL